LQKEYKDSTLSISQRAYLIAKLLRNFGRYLRNIITFNLFFLTLGWIGSYIGVNFLDLAVIELSFATVVIAVFYFATGRRVYRQVREWNEDYLEQAYILIFDTTVPQGNTTGEKVLNLARAIFPELRSDYVDFLSPIDIDYINILTYIRHDL
jgi:hypothetical protein